MEMEGKSRKESVLALIRKFEFIAVARYSEKLRDFGDRRDACCELEELNGGEKENSIHCPLMRSDLSISLQDGVLTQRPESS